MHLQDVYDSSENKNEIKSFSKTIKNRMNKINKYLKRLINGEYRDVKRLHLYYELIYERFYRCREVIYRITHLPTLIQPSADNIQPNDMNELIEYLFMKSNRVVTPVIQTDLNNESKRKVCLVICISMQSSLTR